MKQRLMGLDYGAKTVGVAVSDTLGITAQPVETIWRERETKLRRTLARIDELIEQYQVTELVLGLPGRMNGTLGERGEKTLEFQDMLEKRTGLNVILWDERLTTVTADRAMELAGVRTQDRKEHLDQVAAVLILQSYMDRIRSEKEGGSDGDAL